MQKKFALEDFAPAALTFLALLFMAVALYSDGTAGIGGLAISADQIAASLSGENGLAIVAIASLVIAIFIVIAFLFYLTKQMSAYTGLVEKIEAHHHEEEMEHHGKHAAAKSKPAKAGGEENKKSRRLKEIKKLVKEIKEI